MIGPAGFQQSPKEVAELSIAFKAGQAAKRRGEKLNKSALRNLLPESKQYYDFIAGFDSVGKK